MDVVERLKKIEGAEINDVKIILANEATKLLHGAKAAEDAEKAAQGFFGSGNLSAETMPGMTRTRNELELGVSLIDVLVEGKLASSRKEAKRILAEGAVSINHDKRANVNARLFLAELNEDSHAIVSRGRKSHILISLT